MSGKRIRFRVRIRNGYVNATPTLKTMVTEALVRVPTKRSTTITFRIADHDADLNGDPDDENSGEDKLTLLETWEDTATPLTVSAHVSRLDATRVFIEPYSMQVVKMIPADGQPGAGHETHVCRATLIEV